MTDGCNDIRYRDMLYAYELGMLDKEQMQDYEIHLLSCPYCNEKARKFADVTQLMRHDSDVKASVRKYDESIALSKSKTVHKRSWSRFLPASIAAAAVLAFLILRPWQIAIQPTDEAVAVENRLLVSYFQNIEDPADSLRLAEIVTNLLITDLSESQYIQVISSQRLYDIYQSLRIEKKNIVGEEYLFKAAKKAHARWFLTGNILQTQPNLVVTWQLIDNTTHETSSSTSEVGDETDDIFSIVDKLTVDIKEQLSLPTISSQELDPLIASVTTKSAEAYRHFVEGVSFRSKRYRAEAVTSFEKALEYDSTFAMAYYYLSELKNYRLISQAVKYSENASHREQLYIKSREIALGGDPGKASEILIELIERYPQEKDAHYLLGSYYYNLSRYDDALEAFKTTIDIDSTYPVVYNTMAYLYQEMGKFDNSVWAINIYIALSPNEPNPYDSRGDLYSNNGDLDEAIISYRTALEIKPDFYSSLIKLGHMYIYKQEYEKADSCYSAYASAGTKPRISTGNRLKALIPYNQGKFQKALQMLDEGLIADSLEGFSMQQIEKLRLKSLIYADLGNWQGALDEANRKLEIYEGVRPGMGHVYWNSKIEFLANNGQIEEAEELASKLRAHLEETKSSMTAYWYATGSLERSKGNLLEALEYYEKFIAEQGNINCFAAHYMLALTYLDLDRLGEAVTELEEQLTYYDYWRLYWGGFNVKIHYYLGLAYEQSNWNEQAIQQYETFLEIWKNADPGIIEIDDARERLARLKNRS